jgi:dTDP-4-dehydrorhamnose reductase
MNKKIVVLGSKGCLGQQIIETLKNNSNKLITISRKNFDYIYNYKKIFNIIKKFKPRIIINCAAITKIDKCEKKS